MSGIHGLEFVGRKDVQGGRQEGGRAGAVVLGREFAGGVQITPGAIRAAVDAVLADIGEYSGVTAVSIIAADRLCMAAGRKVGPDERADMEGTCLMLLSEEE